MPKSSGKGHSIDQMKYTKYDIQLMVMDITRNTILWSRNAIASDTNAELFAWGAMIESFDSFISIYYKDDEKYNDARKKYKYTLSFINPHDCSLANKIRVKRIYDLWFALICRKLAKFKIFPPLPTSFAQDLGEIKTGEED